MKKSFIISLMSLALCSIPMLNAVKINTTIWLGFGSPAKQVSVEAQPNDTIQSVAQKLASQAGLSPKSNYEMSGNVQLNGQRTIADYGLDSMKQTNLQLKLPASISLISNVQQSLKLLAAPVPEGKADEKFLSSRFWPLITLISSGKQLTELAAANKLMPDDVTTLATLKTQAIAAFNTVKAEINPALAATIINRYTASVQKNIGSFLQDLSRMSINNISSEFIQFTLLKALFGQLVQLPLALINKYQPLIEIIAGKGIPLIPNKIPFLDIEIPQAPTQKPSMQVPATDGGMAGVQATTSQPSGTQNVHAGTARPMLGADRRTWSPRNIIRGVSNIAESFMQPEPVVPVANPETPATAGVTTPESSAGTAQPVTMP